MRSEVSGVGIYVLSTR